MGVDFSFLSIAFEGALFILFLIKIRQLFHTMIVPMLNQHQQQTNEKWFALQEQHAVLIAKKKHLATLFLQQEKQISLLTAKLETWYKMWQDRQAQQKEFFEVRAQETAQRRAEQKLRTLEQRAAAIAGREILNQVASRLKNQSEGQQKAFQLQRIALLEKRGKQ